MPSSGDVGGLQLRYTLARTAQRAVWLDGCQVGADAGRRGEEEDGGKGGEPRLCKHGLRGRVEQACQVCCWRRPEVSEAVRTCGNG